MRDLVGHGEGIFGVMDGYPEAVPDAPPVRLQAIERRCVAYRWTLRAREGRLARIHGDFHPFNLVFSHEGETLALDASRGCEGDAADDVVCLAINYLFFALEAEGSWSEGFCPLWRAFWAHYLVRTRDDDDDLLLVAPLSLPGAGSLAGPAYRGSGGDASHGGSDPTRSRRYPGTWTIRSPTFAKRRCRRSRPPARGRRRCR